MARVLVTGAGGFIGHHLVKRLKAEGYWVRGVDIKEPEYETRRPTNSSSSTFASGTTACGPPGIDQVYNLAADMGGIGYITAKLADISRNNILINTHMLEASAQSTACSVSCSPPRPASTRNTSRMTPTSRP